MASEQKSLSFNSIADDNRFVPFELNAARGKMDNVFVFKLFGKNADIDLAAAEDIIGIGGTLEEFSVAATADVVSGHADDDDPSGDGMRTVTLYGLDANYELQELAVALNGVAAVTTTGTTWTFIYRAVGTTFGTNGTNTGIITVSVTGGNDVISIAADGLNRSFSAAFMIPADYDGFIYRYSTRLAYIAGATNATIDINVKPFGGVYNTIEPIAIADGEQKNDSYALPEKIDEKSIVKLTGTTPTDDSDFEGKLEIIILPKVS